MRLDISKMVSAANARKFLLEPIYKLFDQWRFLNSFVSWPFLDELMKLSGYFFRMVSEVPEAFADQNVFATEVELHAVGAMTQVGTLFPSTFCLDVNAVTQSLPPRPRI